MHPWMTKEDAGMHGAEVVVKPFGALRALLLKSLGLSWSYNAFLKDLVNDSFMLVLQWPLPLFLAQGLQ